MSRFGRTITRPIFIGRTRAAGPPVLQGFDTFGHGQIIAGMYDNFFGTPAYNTSTVFGGEPASMLVDTSGASGNCAIRKNFSGSPTKVWCGFHFRLDNSYHPTTDVPLFGVQSASSSTSRPNTTFTGGPKVYIGTAGTSSVTFAIAYDTWYWFEYIVDCSLNPWTTAWRVNGVDQTTFTSAVAASTWSFVQPGTVGGQGKFYIGTWAYGTVSGLSDWMGEEMGRILLPNGVGTHVLDASPSLFFFQNDGSTDTAITSSETTSYTRLDEIALGSDTQFIK